MTTYKNLGGTSGVAAYEAGPDRITVMFRGGALYTYTYASAGQDLIEQMKNRAAAGVGLNSFIMRFARTKYSTKSR